MFYKTRYGDSAHTSPSCRHVIGREVLPLTSGDSLPLCKDCGGTAVGLAAGGVGAMVSGEYEEGSYEYQEAMENEHVVMLPGGQPQHVSGPLGSSDWQEVKLEDQTIYIPRGCILKGGEVVDQELHDIQEELKQYEDREYWEKLRRMDSDWQRQRHSRGENPPRYVENADRRFRILLQRETDRQMKMDHVVMDAKSMVEDARKQDRQEAARIEALRKHEETEASFPKSIKKAAKQVANGRDTAEDAIIREAEAEERRGAGEKLAESGAAVAHRGKNPSNNRAPVPRITDHPIQNMQGKRLMKKTAKWKQQELKERRRRIEKEYDIRIRNESDPAMQELLREEKKSKVSMLSMGNGTALQDTYEKNFRRYYTKSGSSTEIHSLHRYSEWQRMELSKKREDTEHKIIQRYFPHLPKEVQTFDEVWKVLNPKEQETLIDLAAEELAQDYGSGFLYERPDTVLRQIAKAEAEETHRHSNIETDEFGYASPEVRRKWTPWMQAVYAAQKKMLHARACDYNLRMIEEQKEKLQERRRRAS